MIRETQIIRYLLGLYLLFSSCSTDSHTFPKALLVDGRPIHPEVIVSLFFGDSLRLEPHAICYKEDPLLEIERAALDTSRLKNNIVSYASTWKVKDYPGGCHYQSEATYRAWELPNGDCLIWLSHHSTEGTGRFSHLGIVAREGETIRNVGELAFGDRFFGGVRVDFFKEGILQYRTFATAEGIQEQLGLPEGCHLDSSAGSLIWQMRFENSRPLERRLVGIDFEL